MIISSRNVSGRDPAFVRYSNIEQRTPLWKEAREGLTGERKGSSSISDYVGAGYEDSDDVVLNEALGDPKQFTGNLFCDHGTLYEPCTRRIVEHVRAKRCYDGGYWVPRDLAKRELQGDSPDGVFAEKDDNGNLVLEDVAEFKTMKKKEPFVQRRVPLGHVIQAHKHMHATGAARCWYGAAILDPPIGSKVPWKNPQVQHVLVAIIYYSQRLMDLIEARFDQSLMCRRATKLHPESPVLPAWDRLTYDGKTVSLKSSVLEGFNTEQSFDINVELVDVTPEQLNTARVLEGWLDDPHPDGLPWIASDGIEYVSRGHA